MHVQKMTFQINYSLEYHHLVCIYRARDGHRGIILFSFRNLCVHMHSPKTKFQRNTPHSKMAANKLFFCLHVNYPASPHFKILLFFIHVDEAKRAN